MPLMVRIPYLIGGGALLVLSLGVISVSAQTNHPERREDVRNHALHGDIVRPYGEYQYLPQKGIYRGTTMGDVVEDFGEAMHGIGSSVDMLNHNAGWRATGSSDGFSWNFQTGLAGIGLPSFGAVWSGAYGPRNDGYLQARAGPLMLDNFYAGVGAIYTDINGNFPGRDSLPPDDRWAYIVWLSFRASLALTDSISLSLQPYMYWLPAKGEVGWGIPGPFAGLLAPQLGAVSFFEISWTKQYGLWKLAAYDRFSPFLAAYNVWDVLMNVNVRWGDMSPIDRVGRYGVGYGSGDLTNYNPGMRFGINNAGWDGLIGFYNIAGVRAYGEHGYHTHSVFYFDRFDVWDKKFRDIFSGISGGAYIQSGDPLFTQYAGYNFASSEPYNLFINSAVVGATSRLGESLSVYGEVGYYWLTGPGDHDQGWLALAGFNQRLGYRSSHGLEAGRRIYKPATSASGVEDYVQYYLNHQLSLRTTFSAFAGISERHAVTNIENDYILKYAGAFLHSRITPRTGAFAQAGWEEVEIEAGNIIFDRWTYRLGLMYSITQDIQSHALYQYEDVHGSLNYSEHYLYLGISKRF